MIYEDLFQFLSGIGSHAYLGGEARGGVLYAVTDLGAGEAYGINASTEVTGINAAGHAYLFSNGTSTDLGTLGGSYSFGLNLNDSGQVVGWADSAGNTSHAFLYKNGTMMNLSPSSLTGGAQGINSSGQVVGWYSTSSSGTQAFLYNNGVETNLGTFPGGSNTYPLSINSSGQVVGYTYQPGLTGEQPFLIDNGMTTILDVSGAFQETNTSGEVVGGRYFQHRLARPARHQWRAERFGNLGRFKQLGIRDQCCGGYSG
jgi:probable HAF family extracellular repeat protein